MTVIQDVLNDPRYQPYLDHGFVGLIDVMGDDRSIDQCARVSYGGNDQVRTEKEIRNLIRYLMRHHHTSPFEMCELKFHLKMPIFVMRQHVRHRTASLNEWSGRYSQMTDEFYIPEPERNLGQSQQNKQQSEGSLDEKFYTYFSEGLQDVYELAYTNYQAALASGISRELARIQLPLSNYTELYWKINLHNFFHYVKLRDDASHAQNEIVQLSQIMYHMVKKQVPIACQAFEDYQKNSLSFSHQECQLLECLIMYGLDIDHLLKIYPNIELSQREVEEFKQKITSIKELK